MHTACSYFIVKFPAGALALVTTKVWLRPCPDDLLSHEVPSTAIAAANKEVEKIVIEGSTTKKRSCYQKFTPK